MKKGENTNDRGKLHKTLGWQPGPFVLAAILLRFSVLAFADSLCGAQPVAVFSDKVLPGGDYYQEGLRKGQQRDLLKQSFALLGISNCFYLQDDIDGALRYVEKAIELNPDYPGSFNNLSLFTNIIHCMSLFPAYSFSC